MYIFDLARKVAHHLSFLFYYGCGKKSDFILYGNKNTCNLIYYLDCILQYNDTVQSKEKEIG